MSASTAPDPGLRWSVLESPVGPLTLVASNAGLRQVWFASETAPPLEPAARATDDDAVGDAGRHLVAASEQLAAYFDGARDPFALTLDLRGTAFQQQVWTALVAIPLGATRTYGAIAAEITSGRAESTAASARSDPGSALSSSPTSARAVAAAVGGTPVPIVVPCHRVIGGDGSLTGYRGGLDRKRALLELEGAAIVQGAAGRPLARASAASGQLPLL